MATTSVPHRWKYDVFVSFRGDDILKNFMDHLFNDFKQKGIHAFRDNKELPKGEEISPHLYKAIKESRYEYKFIDYISKDILKKLCDGPLHVGENLSFEDIECRSRDYADKEDDVIEADHANFDDLDEHEQLEALAGFPLFHPLALKVLGRFLYEKTVGQWVSELDKLKVYPNEQIQRVLRLSYDGLDLHQKNILLDIACLFVGENRDFVASVLDGSKIVVLAWMPFHILTSKFYPENIVAIDLSYSNIKQLWTTPKNLWVDGCKKLEVLPELPPSLNAVSACDCTSLCSITGSSEYPIMMNTSSYLSNCPKLFTNLAIDSQASISETQYERYEVKECGARVVCDEDLEQDANLSMLQDLPTLSQHGGGINLYGPHGHMIEWSYGSTLIRTALASLAVRNSYNALKLVTVAQSKRELTPDIVKAASYRPALPKIPAPQINLVALCLQLNQMQWDHVLPHSSLGLSIQWPHGPPNLMAPPSAQYFARQGNQSIRPPPQSGPLPSQGVGGPSFLAGGGLAVIGLGQKFWGYCTKTPRATSILIFYRS
ncbi:NB-ARC domains-containing protein [Tanacetum coccineum]|uniref:NB-ARC domains-containing protein n=1 Tax=Tanacetum coccineum TaxID=301880 RepID=A0ABQ5CJK9_9ASTR